MPDSIEQKRLITFVVHNENHVRIFRNAWQLLQASGKDCQFAVIAGLVRSDAAGAALTAASVPWIGFDSLEGKLAAGDIVVVANDWSPPAMVERLHEWKRRGIQIVGVVEGCRFGLPARYKTVHQVLAWGPSAIDMCHCRVHVTGSPVLEETLSLPRFSRDENLAAINYKFVYGQEDAGGEWLAAAIAACRSAGCRPAVSAHPAMRPEQLDGCVASEPLSALLPAAGLLISRPSTVIYESLLLGIPVVLFAAKNERLGEFKDTLGAFLISESAKTLEAKVKLAIAARDQTHGPRRKFLDRHLSIDPYLSASERIAHALAKIQAEIQNG